MRTTVFAFFAVEVVFPLFLDANVKEINSKTSQCSHQAYKKTLLRHTSEIKCCQLIFQLFLL